MNTDIILISISKDELKKIIDSAISTALNENSFPEKSSLLSAKEAALFLKCSRSHLSKCVEKNLITCKHLGKRIYFDRTELLKSIESKN